MAIKKEAPKKVKIMIPKSGKGDDARFLAVNGKRILVKTGEPVMVEEKFAEVYYNSLAADAAALAYIEANANK